jgi:hypothetical protein
LDATAALCIQRLPNKYRFVLSSVNPFTIHQRRSEHRKMSRAAAGDSRAPTVTPLFEHED